MTQTIVMMTISDLAKDSRTYKEALSLSRFGYRCIVLQGESGNLDPATLPFELRTVGRPYAGKPQKPRTSSQHSPSVTPAPRPQPKKRWKDKLPSWLHYAMPYSRYLYRQLKYQWNLRKQIPKADLYYLHYFDMYPAVQALAKKHGSAIIYDSHDFHSGMKPIETLSPLERHYIKPWQKRVETHCVHGSQGVVTVCHGVANLMRDTFNRDVGVIRNCHDERLDSYSGKTIRETLQLKPADRLIVGIGHAKDFMAFAQIAEAMRHVPEHVHLAFLGNGYEPFLKNPAYESLRHRIHALSPVKPYEVVPFVRDADATLILYFPTSINTYYSLPNRFFQSIAAGLPVLYPPLPEICRLAAQYQIGVPIDPEDASSLQQGIHQLFDDPDTHATLKKNCHLAHQEISWEQEEKLLKSLVENALASRQPPR